MSYEYDEYSQQPEPPEPPESTQRQDLSQLIEVFRSQLLACLEECAAGRRGLFGSSDYLGDAAPHQPWPEAENLRALAFALQAIQAQQADEFTTPDPIVEEFLDLCSIHGENDPGEAKLARAFLAQIAGRG
jgi:hypothetical protein